MPINNRFKQIRQYYGLSQIEFAKKINKAPSFVSGVENGRTEISQNTIHAVCSVFDVNEDWLVSGKGDVFIEGHDVAEVNRENVGERVRGIRKEEKLTQQEFADAIGYSKRQVLSVEKNKAIPSNEFIRKVAYSFGINYHWLMTGVGEKEAVEVDVDERLIEWLRRNPDIVKELKVRSGIKEK